MLIALIISVFMVSATRPQTAMPAVPAAQYLGASGHREFLSSPSGEQLLVETSLLPGAVAFSDAPAGYQYVLDQLGDTSYELYWANEISEGPTGLTSTLLSLSDAGLTKHAIDYGDGESAALIPGLVELPFAAEAGQSWTSVSKMISTNNTGEQEWTRTGRLETSELPGCLDVYLSDLLPSGRHDTVYTRCPGRGIVRVDDQLATTQFVRDTADLDLTPPGPKAPRTNPVTATFQTGQVPMSVGLTTAPAALGSGLVFANRTNGQLDFTTLTPDAKWDLDWRRRPGDQTLTVLGAGQLVIAATTQATLVAYDDRGRWRWQSTTTDLVSQLVRIDADHFAALSLDGQLSVRRLSDGTEVWQAKVPAGGRPAAQPLPGGTLAVAAGSAITLANPDATHTTELPAEIGALVELDGHVLVADGEANLSALSANGTLLWATSTPDTCNQLASLGRLVICATDDEIVAISPDTRKVSWRQSLTGLTMLSLGDRLLAGGRQASWLLSADGAIEQRWAATRRSNALWIMPTLAGIVLIGSDGETEWWPQS